jgi:SSS family solute:Na+ symporter
VGGALGFALTFILPTVIDALKLFYSLLVVTLFAPILGGLFLPRGGSRGALSSMVVGVVTLVMVDLATHHAGYGWMAPQFLGLVASSVTYLGLAAVGHTARAARS